MYLLHCKLHTGTQEDLWVILQYLQETDNKTKYLQYVYNEHLMYVPTYVHINITPQYV